MTDSIEELPNALRVTISEKTQHKINELCRKFLRKFTKHMAKSVNQHPKMTPTRQRVFLDEQFIWLIRNLCTIYFEIMQRIQLEVSKEGK